MLALAQRVAEARVEIAGRVVGRIGRGLLVFVCAEAADTEAQAPKLVDKLLKLRVFADAAGKMNLDVQTVHGGVLIVSQFTLAADTRSGNRPSFSRAATPVHARRRYDQFVTCMKQRHGDVACGEFGADMQVHLINDGPVTIPIEIGAL
ncbi:MAG TPA: D-aminoacyl-tRNA deacylase [Methylibium sp.]|uniref:D-aminoacyl-tRNA deacylase n=1 Tax=Methylibium sp. TaxID=2067992 RepID=UPI002DB9CC0F|nr:D-aminoacyl-tRNA deacylase [Methylibium sp.]HEU4459221.1 D-aminoacyl-tRNA deacylase [Methylibium sp.]